MGQRSKTRGNGKTLLMEGPLWAQMEKPFWRRAPCGTENQGTDLQATGKQGRKNPDTA